PLARNIVGIEAGTRIHGRRFPAHAKREPRTPGGDDGGQCGVELADPRGCLEDVAEAADGVLASERRVGLAHARVAHVAVANLSRKLRLLVAHENWSRRANGRPLRKPRFASHRRRIGQAIKGEDPYLVLSIGSRSGRGRGSHVPTAATESASGTTAG